MVRRRESAVSNHVAPLVPFILRDAATRLLRMRSNNAITCAYAAIAFIAVAAEA